VPSHYDPPPRDLSTLDLTGSTQDLIETLARCNHDVWARGRLDEGWVYGPETDPQRKTHRCLVAYEELPESEKDFDRGMAIETWKQLVVHGFRVLPPEDDWRATDTEADRQAALLRGRLERGEPIPHAELMAEWLAQERDPRRWARHPSLYGLVAQQLLHVGEPDQSYDVATAGLRLVPGNPALVRWQAMALLELAAPRRAVDCLTNLLARHDDAETRGFLAYARMRYADELGGRTTAGTGRSELAAAERQALAQAHEDFCGATSSLPVWRLMFLVSRALVAARLGRPDLDEAVRQAEAELAAFAPAAGSATEVFWRHAFAGLLGLLGADPAAAVGEFHAAARQAEHRHGLIAIVSRIVRRQAAGLDEHTRLSIERCFIRPTVVVFAGHMFDQPGNGPPRFPAAAAETVRNSIRRALLDCDTLIGFGSAACGADLLFHEVVAEMGGDSHVVLPYERDAFCSDSVALPGLDAEAMRARFDAALDRAVEVSELCRQQLVPGSGSYTYCNRVLFGMALLHADRVGGVVRPMCLWDGRPGRGPGGTSAVTQMWVECGYRPTIIPLPSVPPAASPQSVGGPLPADLSAAGRPAAARPVETVNQAILFADVRGFSKLSEEQLAAFIDHYIGTVGAMCRPTAPIHAHTAGDGLYMVFRTCREAGLFGLDLADLRQRQGPTFAALGLPVELDIRVAIHYGPVLFRLNPVTGQPDYFGQHVSRAARLEPVTALNSVFVTYEFAAWARTENITEFACDYLGRLDFAKAYGNSAAYALRRLD